jgi:hypothetical protein
MSSPPNPSNILLDPLPELTQAIKINLFGLDPSSSTLPAESYPSTPEEVQLVKASTSRRTALPKEIRAKAKIILLEGDILDVVLDQRGYTVCVNGVWGDI